MYTILGAGGCVSNELVNLLAARNLPFRTVSRQGTAARGSVEDKSADLLNHEQTLEAVAGSDIVFLLAGLKYDHKLWADQWPRIIDNVVDASKRASSRLIFFDNVYMYGKVNGPMTEETPYHPTSRKGEVRAQIATSVEKEWKSGELKAMIARAADFYGPGAKTGLPNVLVFDPWSRGQKAMCLASDACRTPTPTSPTLRRHSSRSLERPPRGTGPGICPLRRTLRRGENSSSLQRKPWASHRTIASSPGRW